MIKFTKERIVLLYQMIIEAMGGSFGIRDEKGAVKSLNFKY